MIEKIIINNTLEKKSKYQSLIPQIENLIIGETDLIAILANISAALKEAMNFFWVGFYLVKQDELVLGPFQGPIACTRIKKEKGVCGTVWANARSLIVEDVKIFPNHISCSRASKSEIALPAFKNNKVALVLDVDSDILNNFDCTDELYLQKVILMIEKNFNLGQS